MQNRDTGCLLSVGVVGLNHKTADLALREAMAKGTQGLWGQKACFFSHPTVLLSTCNRTEIYFSAQNLSAAHADLLGFLRLGVDGAFEQRLYSYFHADCFAHLCRVTAGMDSAILAESEIQRQVKVAYATAAKHQILPSCLHYIFQKALKVAKGLRSQFAIEQTAPTLYSTLYDLAEKFWGSLQGKNILFVGYSEILRGFASFLQRKGIDRFFLATQYPENVVMPGAVVYGRDLLDRWIEFDWILAASRSEEPLIQGTSSKRHLVFDLSVPRNVDPKIGENRQIKLMNIEQINQVIEERRVFQGNCLEECEAFLWDQVVCLSKGYRQKVERSFFYANRF